MSRFITRVELENYIEQIYLDEAASTQTLKIFVAPSTLVARFAQTKYAEKLAEFFEIKDGVKPEVKITTREEKNEIAKNINMKNIRATSLKLLPNLTFENFVVGSSNQVAFSACHAIAHTPEKAYKIVFIYGSTGLGKTHLLQAIGNSCMEQGREVLFMSAEQFMNDFVKNISGNTMSKFKERYRSCDVLLIDDIQFLGRGDKAQEEFFHTFNEIHDSGGFVVLTSDKPPKLLDNFDGRLKTRFEWELCTDITPPDLETKICIIRNKCENEGINLSKDVVEYIAVNMGDNIREIQSAIISINAHAAVVGESITLEFAKNIIKDRIKEFSEKVDIEDIIRIVSQDLNIKPSDITDGTRTKQAIKARQICSYLAKNLINNVTMQQLAKSFGMSDHTAIVKNNKKIEKDMENDSLFKAKIEELKSKTRQKM